MVFSVHAYISLLCLDRWLFDRAMKHNVRDMQYLLQRSIVQHTTSTNHEISCGNRPSWYSNDLHNNDQLNDHLTAPTMAEHVEQSHQVSPSADSVERMDLAPPVTSLSSANLLDCAL